MGADGTKYRLRYGGTELETGNIRTGGEILKLLYCITRIPSSNFSWDSNIYRHIFVHFFSIQVHYIQSKRTSKKASEQTAAPTQDSVSQKTQEFSVRQSNDTNWQPEHPKTQIGCCGNRVSKEILADDVENLKQLDG
jgi:hypothetical protein